MSTIQRCLDGKVEAGRLSREQAEEAMGLIRRLEVDYARTMTQSAAEAAAAARASEILKDQLRVKQRQTALQALAVNRTLLQAQDHPKGIYAGVAGVLARDWWSMAKGTSVEARIKTVRRDLFRRWSAGVEAFQSKLFGLKVNEAGLVNFVRALYGESVDDKAATAAAKAWVEMADHAVERYNAAGGVLRPKKDWRLPQRMESSKVKKSRQAWIGYMLDAYHSGRVQVWDYEKMAPMDIMGFSEVVSLAYDAIATNGLVNLTPGMVGKLKLANKRLDHRVFEWTSAESWIDANRTWASGDSSIYGILTGHVDAMGRDIALLEMLGPNPDLTARTLIDTARQREAGGLKIHNLEAIYDHVSGRANEPVAGWLANFGGGVRAWLQSSQLGSALLTSVTDFQTMKQAAKWNGIPASKVVLRYSALVAGSPTAKQQAVRTGMIAESVIHSTHAALRDTVDETVAGISGLLSTAVIRASGLSKHTDSLRQAFGLEYLAMLADHAGKRFDTLPAPLRKTFQRYGLDARKWDTIRQGVENFSEPGMPAAYFISPAKLDGLDRRTGAQLMDLIETEMDYAVLQPGAREKSLMLGKSRRGSFGGEFRRSIMQYKSFAVTMLTTHLMRGIAEEGLKGKFAYLAPHFIGLTTLGALSYQMREIVKGRDPQNMADAKFWVRAAAQGGGLGVMGDFLYSAVDRHGYSFLGQMAGPAFGLAVDALDLGPYNVGQVARDEDANFGRDLARFVERYTPGSSLWYARLALDRLVWDNLQGMLDPRAKTSFRRTEQRAKKETGQQFWWRPGKLAPHRAPGSV